MQTIHLRRQKPILDYSAPAEEQQRARAIEDERRDAIERYNESTFGESRSVLSDLLRSVVVLAGLLIGAYVALWFLPRKVVGCAVFVFLIGFAVWETRKRGWTSNGWTTLRHPWRRW